MPIWRDRDVKSLIAVVGDARTRLPRGVPPWPRHVLFQTVLRACREFGSCRLAQTTAGASDRV